MVVYAIFVLSGAAALVYQIIWSRWLGLVFGNTTISVSIVLGSFMLGLALGSWLVGKCLQRIKNPLTMHAAMELGIGLFALYFSPIAQLVDTLFTLLVTTESPEFYQVLAKTASSFLLLLVPTTLMGATLPLLTEFFRLSPRPTFTWKVGLLYAANTLGAAAGTFFVSFFMIERFGVDVTTVIAADVNIAIAAIAFLYARKAVLLSRDSDTDSSRRLEQSGLLALCVLGVSGATALASEVLWTRTIESLVGSSTYAFATIVIVYLLGIALGSWIMSLVVNRLSSLALWLAGMLLGMGLWTVIAVFLFDGIINSLSPYKGQMIPLAVLLTGYLRAVGILIPLSLFSGACFPIATRIINPVGEDARGVLIARAYAWNTVGAVFGSLAAGFAIAPFFDYLASLYVLAAIYTLAALAVVVVLTLPAFSLVACRRSVKIALGTISVILLIFSTARLTDSTYYKRHLELKFPNTEVVSHRPGLQGVTTVLKRRGDPFANRLLVNGMGMTIKITDTKMMAHLPMLLHPDPRNTLVICFGMGTTYRSAVSYGRKVTVVELVKEVLDAFPSFYGDAERVRAYPHGRMVVNDGRNFLKLTRERYDVITIDPPPPIDAAGVNNLYSLEFLELAKARLKSGGIMAHWIPFPGKMGGVDDWKTFNMLVATFREVFPYTYTQTGFHGVGLHVLGSMSPFSVAADQLPRRIDDAAPVKQDLTEWDAVPPEYFRGVTLLRSGTPSVPRVTDDRPRLEFYLLRTWKEGGEKMYIDHYW